MFLFYSAMFFLQELQLESNEREQKISWHSCWSLWSSFFIIFNVYKSYVIEKNWIVLLQLFTYKKKHM